MSIAASKAAASRRTRTYRGFSADLVLLVGFAITPGAIAVAANSWSAPNDADYVRMTFATVVGSTIAIVSALGPLAHRIVRRASVSTIATLSLIAVVVVLWQVSVIRTAGEILLTRLAS